MNKKLLLSVVLCGLTKSAILNAVNLTLHNETGSKAIIKLPNADDFMKTGLRAHLSLWQIDPTSDEAISIKFKGKTTGYNLMNKTFRIKPAMSAKWGDLPDGRIELHAGSVDPLTAQLEYKDANGTWKSMDLEVK